LSKNITGIDVITRKLPINILLLRTVHPANGPLQGIIGFGDCMLTVIFRKWSSNNARRKIITAEYMMAKESCDKNVLGSPRLVRTTTVPVKAKPAIRPHAISRPITNAMQLP